MICNKSLLSILVTTSTLFSSVGEELEYEYDDRGHNSWLCRIKYVHLHSFGTWKLTVEFANKSWRNYLLCHTWQGSQLQLDPSPDTEKKVQGSVPSSVSALLFVLTGFGFPKGWKSEKQESRFFQLPLFRAICEIEIQEKKLGNNLFQFLLGKIKKTPN